MTDRPDVIRSMLRFADYIRARIRTVTPGNVISYDAAQRRAKVQPARKGRKKGGSTFSLPPIPGCPVLWQAFGGAIQEGDLVRGDPVLIVVSDREIWPWIQSGEREVEPSRWHMHSMADAFVYPGAMTAALQRKLAAHRAGEFWSGRQDGQAGVAVSTRAPTVTLEGGPASGVLLGRNAAHPAVYGDELQSALLAFAATVASANTTWGGSSVTGAAFSTALGAALVALQSELANVLSPKVMIE